MEISVQKLLLKMEQELQAAKSSGTNSQVRERVHAIKTLCELVLESQSGETTRGLPRVNPVIPTKVEQILTSSPVQTQPKKLQIDDESNGDSLFDF
nr:YwdI family protein [Robertmurraya korlensis]